MNRNELIANAHRKIGLLKLGTLTPAQLESGIELLNLIIEEENLLGASQDRQLWTERTRPLLLFATRLSYATSGSANNLPADIERLEAVSYRDAAGEDRPLRILTAEAYQELERKEEPGEPARVHLERGRTPAGNRLFVHPVLATVTSGSTVLGSDGLTYTCVKKHTATNRNRPIVGADYDIFWTLAGSGGAAWVSGTTYDGQEVLLLTYKRPLAAFSLATENADMPKGWERYLTHRLAYDLCPDNAITIEERNALDKVAKEAREALFPSSRPRTNDVHNKALFF